MKSRIGTEKRIQFAKTLWAEADKIQREIDRRTEANKAAKKKIAELEKRARSIVSTGEDPADDGQGVFEFDIETGEVAEPPPPPEV